jgi:class 3 adenylate cyclase
MASTIQRGYFVLADISGYTAFMAGNELDHVQGILDNILTLIIRHLTLTLTLIEVEGDAVFAFTPQSKMPRGETLLELVETAYVTFRDRQKTMQRNATCACNACQAIHHLDLKFVIHYGEYILQNVMGHDKPIGSCVNIAHRLLKNKVSEATGWRGYALFSEESLKQMGVWPQEMHPEVEAYEHLGEVPTHSINLDLRYKELTENRRTLLRAEEADVALTHHFSAPPPIVWDWLNDPPKRTIWMKGSSWAVKERPRGRTGPGTHNHCTNYRFIEEILDWRPFEYFTVRYSRGFLKLIITGELKPTAEGTQFYWNMKLDSSWPRRLLCPICKLIAMRLMKMQQCFETVERLIAAEKADSEGRA